MYKIRFHLAAGKYYKYWQIKTPTQTWYENPKTTLLSLTQCRLHNQPGTAKKIHQGASRAVCGWIACQTLTPIEDFDWSSVRSSLLLYDPKIAPYWRDERGRNIDGLECDRITIAHRNLCLIRSK